MCWLYHLRRERGSDIITVVVVAGRGRWGRNVMPGRRVDDARGGSISWEFVVVVVAEFAAAATDRSIVVSLAHREWRASREGGKRWREVKQRREVVRCLSDGGVEGQTAGCPAWALSLLHYYLPPSPLKLETSSPVWPS